MPHINEWKMHFPRDWTPQQALAYARDTTLSLNQAVLPAMLALGPTQCVSIMLTVVAQIARYNPVYVADILNVMVRTAALIENMDGFKTEARQ